MQNVQSVQEGHDNGGFWWLKLRTMSSWLKHAVVAIPIAISFYIGAAQPAPVRAWDYDVGDETALVNAIIAANASSEADTITFTNNITLTGNLPIITNTMTFDGNNYFISGNDAYRVFFIGSFDSAPTVTFENLTIQHGLAQGGDGGGGGAGMGGGIFVYDGNVTVKNVIFANNAAQGGSRIGGFTQGGGGMGANGGDSYGGGGGLWAGANGGSDGNNGSSADDYGGGGGIGGAGGGLNGGTSGTNSGGGGGVNGSNGGDNSGGAGGWGGGGGAGYDTGGNGGFGGGAGAAVTNGGWGGFGGGGGAADNYGGGGGFGGGSGPGNIANFGSGFGGSSDGGGAGLGGGLFIRTGVLTMTNIAFNDNTATGGTANGLGLGGGMFVLHTTTNANGNDQGMPATLPSISADSCEVTFSGNTAQDDAGTATDNDDVFGDLSAATRPCELTLTKSVTPETKVAYHSLVTYTLTLFSPENDTVLVTDTLPSEMALAGWVLSPTHTLHVGNTITWTGDITAGETLTWTFAMTHTGAYADIITNTAAFSGTTRAGSDTATFDVEWSNYPPVLMPIGDQAVTEEVPLTFTATASDDGKPTGALTYTLDAGSVGDITTGGVYTWTATESDGPGVYTATVRVSDGELEDAETFTITVNEVNQPPALWPIGDKTADAPLQFYFTARTTDLDRPLNPLTYTLDAGSVGSIGARTGLFTWTPGDMQSPDVFTAGVFTATVRVTDGEFEDAETFNIAVNVDTPGMGYWVLVPNSSGGDWPFISSSNFHVVDTADNAVYGPFLDGQLGSSSGVRFDVAVTPDGSTALISNFGDSAVFLVDVTNPISPSLITSVTLPFFAEDIDISADGRYALVTDGGFSSMVASIDIPSATLVYTAELGTRNAQAVEIAPDGTIIVPDYSGGAIHTLLLIESGEIITTGHTYTYTYPGLEELPWPINVSLSPDGQTLIVCNAFTSTVGVYQIVAPGVLSFTGVITGLHGDYEFYSGSNPGIQSVAFNAAGDKAYVSIPGMITAGTTVTDPFINTGDRVGILHIAGPGQVSLEAGGVTTVPHHTSNQLFGVDTIVVAGNKVYVGYPNTSSNDELRPLAVVDLTDYSVTTTMVFTAGRSIPTGVAAVPLRLDLHQTVSDPEPVPGQRITYTLTLVNPGPHPMTGITLRDALPPEVDFIGPITLFPSDVGIVGSAPPTLATNLVISAYQQVTVTFPVRVNVTPPGTVVTNTARAESPKLETAAITERTFVVLPHLALHKAVSDPEPNPYQVITYILTLTNTDVTDDPSVMLTDTLPTQTSFHTWVTQPTGALASNGIITWTGPLAAGEVLTFTLSVTQTGSYDEVVTNIVEINGMAQTITATSVYTVESNVAPVLAFIGNQTADELVTLVFTATASDANGYPPLVFSLDSGSVGNITPGGVFSWIPTEAQGPGVYTATVRVSDGELDDSETFRITVADVNSAPALGDIAPQTIDELTTLIFTVPTTDSDIPVQPLTYTLAAGSTGYIASNIFIWTPKEVDGPGVYTAAVYVSDGMLSDTATFSITVREVNQHAPILATIGDRGVVELMPLTFNATATDGDIPHVLTFTLDAGSVGTITTDGIFTWTPQEDDGGSVYTATVRVSDGEFEDVETFAITVRSANIAPVASGDTFTVTENSRENRFDVLAGDTDADGDSLYVLIVGTPDQGGTAINAGTAITYTPARDFAGQEHFTYAISDGYGGFATAWVTVTVTPLPTYTLTVNRVGSGTVVLDSDLPAYKAGTAVTLTAIPEAGWQFDRWSGAASISLTQTHVIMSSDQAITATFSLKAVNHAPVADAGGDQSVQPGTAVTLDGGGSTDPDGDALTYLWQQTGGVAVDFTPTLSRTTFIAPAPGPLTFTLTVTDMGELYDVDEVIITVGRYRALLPVVLRAAP
ncbi:MAG: tandem-95 repeat protein [Anaerolineae bacterium]|nr:tandem-95 repeat protein [Anaerolineae bacterium]